MVMKYKSEQDRIILNIFVDDNGCWIWQRANTRGYGNLNLRGRNMRAHRFAYLIFVGPIRKGLSVLHRCDVPACCNPEHLFLGTQSDNVMDAVKKGRHKTPRCPPEKYARGDKNGMRKHPGLLSGEKNGRSKVTNRQRIQIVRLKARGVPTSYIAKKFSLHATQINNIYKGGWAKWKKLKQRS